MNYGSTFCYAPDLKLPMYFLHAKTDDGGLFFAKKNRYTYS